MKIVVLDGRALNPGDLSWEAFEAFGECTIYDRTDLDDIDERISGAQIVLTNKTPIRKEHLEKASDLRYIGVLATGYDVVDIDEARARGIPVTNVPTYGTNSVAQFVFALLLELIHQTADHDELVKNLGWRGDWSVSLTNFSELSGKKMGILGLGRIGQAVARLARAFGMEVLGVDRGKPIEGVTLLPLEDFLRHSDVISLHTPLTESSRGIIEKEHLSLMKPTAYLINTARGPLVNEEDLAEALNNGRLAGAGLDVLGIEPNTDSPLLVAKNVLLSPHRAWSAKEARARLMDQAFENLRNWHLGKPTHVVNLP